MHSINILLAASALAGHAFARSSNTGSLHKRHSNDITSKLTHGLLLKRQIEPGSEGLPDGIPAECTSICTTYLEVTTKCYDISPEAAAADPSGALIQEDILKCACSNDFFQATRACIECIPASFNEGTLADVQGLMDQAAAQCAAGGYPVDGNNASARESEWADNTDTPASSSTTPDVEATTAEPSDSATPSDTTASSATPQSSAPAPTGAASTLRAQGILALASGIIPAALGGLYLL